MKEKEKLPKVLTLTIAKKPRHGIRIYSTVQSRSRARVTHLVTGTKKRLYCSCEARSFNPHAVCIHKKAVRKLLK
jgi:hypothetical protein